MDNLQSALQEVFQSTNILVDQSGNPWSGSLESAGTKVVALYFSAHWCPPCRQFTPVLKDAFTSYKNSPGDVKKVNVVFVSADRSLSDMKSYMQESHGDWPAIEPGHPLGGRLNQALGIRGIPSLIVVSNAGEVLAREGRGEIMSSRSMAFETWSKMYVDLDTSIVETLKDNPPDVTKDAAEILVKLFGNVLKDPQSMKFRSIRLANPKIESKLLSANGAFEILFSVGFEEGTDTLILPFDANLSLIKAFKETIEKLLHPQGASASTPSPSAPKQIPQPTYSPQVSQGQEQAFLERILNEHQLCLEYEKPEVQRMVNEAVPLQQLTESAIKMLEELKKVDKIPNEQHLLKDLVVLELLKWFKHDFFTWMDDVKCSHCSSALKFKSHVMPDSLERMDGAGSVEIFVCDGCHEEIRQPRYHSRPEKLLNWKRGRCGEWANCFAMILRALGYETRRVMDWTDHVWCEFYSDAEGRWIHADPCENVMDSPLLYEQGWGKKLSYCIAVSKDEVQDVTWRYSNCSNDAEKQEILKRRGEVKEDWLTKKVLELSDKFQSGKSEDRKKVLRERRMKEIIELMTMKKKEVSASEKKGRQTGSLAWRLARGEAGDQTNVGGYAFKLTEKEISSKTFHVEFNVAKNNYVRYSDGESVIENWHSCVKEAENITRKEEFDWKMVYLARNNQEKASISWTLDLTGSGLAVKTVELLVNSKTYENGRIIWQLCGGNQCVLPMPGVEMKTDQLCGSKELKVGAILSGGKGNVAWQHTQLFRSEMSSTTPQFKLIVIFQDDEK